MAKYIDMTALVAELDKRIKNCIVLQQTPEMSDLQEELQCKIDCLNSIKGYIVNTLEVKEVQDDIVSEDLEKAAGELDESMYRSDAFKVGAKWHEQQMMKDAFDATVCKVGSTYLKEMDRDTIAKALEPYKDGDRVKVIIKVQKGE